MFEIQNLTELNDSFVDNPCDPDYYVICGPDVGSDECSPEVNDCAPDYGEDDICLPECSPEND